MNKNIFSIIVSIFSCRNTKRRKTSFFLSLYVDKYLMKIKLNKIYRKLKRIRFMIRFINTLLFDSYAIPKFKFFNVKLKKVQILMMDRSVTVDSCRWLGKHMHVKRLRKQTEQNSISFLRSTTVFTLLAKTLHALFVDCSNSVSERYLLTRDITVFL